jgi:hypothetical protein
MKTVTLKNDNRSILIAGDNETVLLLSDHVVKGQERIYGLLSFDIVLHENVTIPSNWQPSRYFFDGNRWELNPKWVDTKDTRASTE